MCLFTHEYSVVVSCNHFHQIENKCEWKLLIFTQTINFSIEKKRLARMMDYSQVKFIIFPKINGRHHDFLVNRYGIYV